jgi:hypothetical protein
VPTPRSSGVAAAAVIVTRVATIAVTSAVVVTAPAVVTVMASQYYQTQCSWGLERHYVGEDVVAGFRASDLE